MVLSWGYFGSLMFAYSLLRPLRESQTVTGGYEAVPWLFTGTFVVMLVVVPIFGTLVSRFSQRVFLPVIYLFFIVNLLIFHAVLASDVQSAWTGHVYFVWLSVFNLFVVSVFWSFMANLYQAEQAKRLFGPIAAGGSLAAIVGSLLSSILAEWVSVQGIMLLAAILLAVALWFQMRLLRHEDSDPDQRLHSGQPIGGSMFAGATELLKSPYLGRIGLLLVFLPIMNTVFYYAEIYFVEQMTSSEAQARHYFSLVNLGANVVAFALQFALTATLIRRLGAAWALALMPILTIFALIAFSLSPTLLVMGIAQVIRRGGEYGLMKPARDVLYTRVTREQKFKSKNFIDTVIYRGGDVASGHLYHLLNASAGLSIKLILLLVIPMAGLWAWLAQRTGREFEDKQDPA